MTPTRKRQRPRAYLSPRAMILEAQRVTGLSARALATRIDCNERTVRYWLAGDRPMSARMVQKITKLLATYPQPSTESET